MASILQTTFSNVFPWRKFWILNKISLNHVLICSWVCQNWQWFSTGSMAWCCQEISFHQKQCWHRPMMPQGHNELNQNTEWIIQKRPGPRFNIKMLSYQYRKSHCGDKTVVRSSYLHNGISYTGKMASLYWFSPLLPGLIYQEIHCDYYGYLIVIIVFNSM